MNRSPLRALAATTLLLMTTLPVLAAKQGAPLPSETTPLHARGEIVDCTDYIMLGRKGPERRDMQAANIDSGMPACFISDQGDVYLLLELGGHARSKFQPTQTWIAGDIIVDGVVYQQGSLKALNITQMQRTGAYSDRQSRRASNPEPTVGKGVKEPKKTRTPAAPEPSEEQNP